MVVEKDVNKRIAVSIKKRRLELGYSQAKLAQLANVSVNTIQRAEYGTGPISALNSVRISVALGWDTDGIDRLRDGDHPDPVIKTEPAVVEHASVDGDDNDKMARILEAITEIKTRAAGIEESNSDLREALESLTQMYGDLALRLDRVERRGSERSQ